MSPPGGVRVLALSSLTPPASFKGVKLKVAEYDWTDQHPNSFPCYLYKCPVCGMEAHSNNPPLGVVGSFSQGTEKCDPHGSMTYLSRHKHRGPNA